MLLLLAGIVGFAFAGPVNASAASIFIDDTNEVDLENTVNGLHNSKITTVVESIQLGMERDGSLKLEGGTWVAPNPLVPDASQTFNFNMNDPAGDGAKCCSDTLSITVKG